MIIVIDTPGSDDADFILLLGKLVGDVRGVKVKVNGVEVEHSRGPETATVKFLDPKAGKFVKT